MTALHLASKEGHAEICQHLLDVGATEEIFDAVSFATCDGQKFIYLLS